MELHTIGIDLGKTVFHLVQLVLVAVFQPFEEPITERRLRSKPRIRLGVRRTPARHDIRIAIVTRDLDKAIEPLPRNVGDCEIDRVVSFSNVKGSPVHCDSFNCRRNEKIRISVAVSVGIGGQVVRVEKSPI